jgi:hypothetical protein
MGYKHLREFGLTAKNPTHFQDFHPHRHAVRHRRSCCQTLWLSDQAAFTKEIVGAQEPDDGLFSLFGHYGDFDLAFFYVENCIGGVALRKELVSLSVRETARPLAVVARKVAGSNRRAPAFAAGRWSSSTFAIGEGYHDAVANLCKIAHLRGNRCGASTGCLRPDRDGCWRIGFQGTIWPMPIVAMAPVDQFSPKRHRRM